MTFLYLYFVRYALVILVNFWLPQRKDNYLSGVHCVLSNSIAVTILIRPSNDLVVYISTLI